MAIKISALSSAVSGETLVLAQANPVQRQLQTLFSKTRDAFAPETPVTNQMLILQCLLDSKKDGIPSVGTGRIAKYLGIRQQLAYHHLLSLADVGLAAIDDVQKTQNYHEKFLYGSTKDEFHLALIIDQSNGAAFCSYGNRESLFAGLQRNPGWVERSAIAWQTLDELIFPARTSIYELPVKTGGSTLMQLAQTLGESQQNVYAHLVKLANKGLVEVVVPGKKQDEKMPLPADQLNEHQGTAASQNSNQYRRRVAPWKYKPKFADGLGVGLSMVPYKDVKAYLFAMPIKA